MLVQLSPWKRANTSIQVSQQQPTRRRKRESNEAPEGPSVLASFVTTSSRRGLDKMRSQSTELSHSVPVLMLTSEHRITVVGRSSKEGEHEYNEYSSSLNYASRPGKMGSFVGTTKNDTPAKGKSKSSATSNLPAIPALLDTKSNHVYALQQENSQLCCWKAMEGNGPDDDKCSSKVNLKSPALSLSLLSLTRGVIMYGTCLNGELFVAWLVGNRGRDDMFMVEYLPSQAPSEAHHLYTLALLSPTATTVQTPAGRKRKISDMDGTNSHFAIYQVYEQSGQLTLIETVVSLDGGMSQSGPLLAETQIKRRSTTLSLLVDTQEISYVDVIVSSRGASPTVAIVYKLQAKNVTCPKMCCALISLTTGDFVSGTIALPEDCHHYGLIADKILAVTTDANLMLVDLESGATLHSMGLPDEAVDSDNSFSMVADCKFGAVGVLTLVDGTVQVSLASMTTEENRDVTSSTQRKYSLAARMASNNMATSASIKNQAHVDSIQVTDVKNKRLTPESDGRQTVMNALLLIQRSASTSGNSTKQKQSLLEAYKAAITMIASHVQSGKPKLKDISNPQDASPTNGIHRKNGVVALNGSNGKTMRKNGVHDSSIQKSKSQTLPLPQGFVDGALEIIFGLLRSDQRQSECLEVLTSLCQTSKISARRFFDGVNGAKLLSLVLRSNEVEKKSTDTSMDFIFLILKRCPDLSERHLVLMMKHIIRRSEPQDMIKTLLKKTRKPKVCPRFRELAERFSKERSRHLNGTKRSKEGEQLDRRIVLAGASLMLRKMLHYSECNSAMLQVAFEEEMDGFDAAIMAQLLSKSLLAGRETSNFNKSTCQWISALSNAFQAELSEMKLENGQSCLTVLLGSVSCATKQVQALLHLKERMILADQRILPGSDNTKALKPLEEVPGYSIDHLVF